MRSMTSSSQFVWDHRKVQWTLREESLPRVRNAPGGRSVAKAPCDAGLADSEIDDSREIPSIRRERVRASFALRLETGLRKSACNRGVLPHCGQSVREQH